MDYKKELSSIIKALSKVRKASLFNIKGDDMKTYAARIYIARSAIIAEQRDAVRADFLAALKRLGVRGSHGKRAPAGVKYRSRKNYALSWSGRGVIPVWMREEMKGTKLKKTDFLIKKAK